MITKKTLGILSLALAISFPVIAQDNTEPFPAPPAPKTSPPQDPGNWRPSDNGEPPVLAPAPANRGAKKGLLPNPAPAVKKDLSEEERAKRDRAIQRNYDQAEGILRKTLDDKESAYQSTSTRVSRLKGLIVSYEKKQRTALARKRQIQVSIFNRTLDLQRRKEAGTIPLSVYNTRMVEETRRFEREKKNLDADLVFLNKEIAQLKKKLSEQQAEKRVQEAINPSLLRKKNAKNKATQPTLPDFVSKKIKALSAFEIKGSLGNERLDGHP
jgi:hypothetical protein